MSGQTKKLAVLRARTDHDLVILVQREIDRSLTLVNVVSSKGSPLFGHAVHAYETAASMLPRVSGLSQQDRVRLEARLKELRAQLDQVPAFANVKSYPASFAS